MVNLIFLKKAQIICLQFFSFSRVLIFLSDWILVSWLTSMKNILEQFFGKDMESYINLLIKFKHS